MTNEQLFKQSYNEMKARLDVLTSEELATFIETIRTTIQITKAGLLAAEDEIREREKK